MLVGELALTSLRYAMEPKNQHDYLAIDVAKDQLHCRSQTQRLCAFNHAQGHDQIVATARQLPQPCLVLEATGGYEQTLLARLRAEALPAIVVNPRRLRAFAISEGVHAKTDPIDAQMLLRFAQQKQLQPLAAPAAANTALAALMDRRAHLVGALAREKNRDQNGPEDPFIRKTRRESLRWHQRQIDKIEQEIRHRIAADPALRTPCGALLNIAGVGEITAWSILAYMPEITQLGRNQAVALAGLAPYNRDSGKKQGLRCIHAGRAKVRKALYMAAVSAAQHNPVIKAFVNRLIKKGKPTKVAYTAAMRKLFIHIRSTLIEHQNST